MKKVEESKNSADTSNVMYPGDVTIEYPPRINNAVNNSVVSEKSKDEMSLDEYKQWVMNQISQFPVSGWVRSTFSSGSIVIKEEAFERMKNDPEYENYVLNRVRSAYSVQGLPVGSNNVGFDVIGASPEECYGYAGPVGKSGSETANDGESWWEKRHERMEELMKEQEKEGTSRTSPKKENNIFKIWIARDISRYISDDEKVQGDLTLFYDTPQLVYDSNLHTHIFSNARVLAKLPVYMFPNVKEGEYLVFEDCKNLKEKYRDAALEVVDMALDGKFGYESDMKYINEFDKLVK